MSCPVQILLNPASLDFLKFFVPLVGAVIAWILNERRKRVWEEYQRKELRYQELLRTARGFYAAINNQQMKNAFIEQLILCWLYCPDEVIRRGYALLNAINSPNTTDAERHTAHANFVVAIRKDLISRTITSETKLAAADYQHL